MTIFKRYFFILTYTRVDLYGRGSTYTVVLKVRINLICRYNGKSVFASVLEISDFVWCWSGRCTSGPVLMESSEIWLIIMKSIFKNQLWFSKINFQSSMHKIYNKAFKNDLCSKLIIRGRKCCSLLPSIKENWLFRYYRVSSYGIYWSHILVITVKSGVATDHALASTRNFSMTYSMGSPPSSADAFQDNLQPLRWTLLMIKRSWGCEGRPKTVNMIWALKEKIVQEALVIRGFGICGRKKPP